MTISRVATPGGPAKTIPSHAVGGTPMPANPRTTPFARLLMPALGRSPLPAPGLERGAGPGAPVGARGDERPRSVTSDARCEEGDERPARASRHWSSLDPTDPMVRSLHGPAWLIDAPAVPGSASPTPETTVSSASRVSLEHLLPRLVRRVAWSGDAQRGTARLELGEGALEGATLTIHSDGGAVRVSLELPPGVDAQAWKERIARRLDARGLYVAELEVR